MRPTVRRCSSQNLLHAVQLAIEAKSVLASSPFQQRREFLRALRADMTAHTADILRANRHDCEAFTQQTEAAAAASSPVHAMGTTYHGAGLALTSGDASSSLSSLQQQQQQRTSRGRATPGEPSGEALGPFYHSAFTSRASHRQRLFPLRFEKMLSVVDYLLDQPDPIAVPQDCWLSPHYLRRAPSPSPPQTPPPSSLRTGADPQVEVHEIRVPLGLVGVLSRYRPRMLLDATTMGIFAGNTLLLDGGVSLHCTNAALTSCARRALTSVGLPTAAIAHVESYDVHSRLTAEWLHMTDRVDMGLVCGPPKLYEFACRNASIQLIRATSRSCSLFVHESASYDTALRVILNAKRQVLGAANAVTTLIIDRKFPRYVELLTDLVDEGIALLGDYPARDLAPECIREIASDEEYRGLSQGLRDFSETLCVKTVDSVDQALFFLDLFGSKQTDGILASDEAAIAAYCSSADSAVVLVNASTRLSSGNPLGCGPDLAITTTKVHCRGPFTLSALTTKKFVVRSRHEDGALRR